MTSISRLSVKDHPSSVTGTEMVCYEDVQSAYIQCILEKTELPRWICSCRKRLSKIQEKKIDLVMDLG